MYQLFYNIAGRNGEAKLTLLTARACIIDVCFTYTEATPNTTPEKFENGGFALKMFSVHTSAEEFKNATITGHFGFVFEKNSGRKVS